MPAHIYFDVRHSFPVFRGSTQKRKVIAQQVKDKVVDIFKNNPYPFLAGADVEILGVDFTQTDGFSRICVHMRHLQEEKSVGRYLKWNDCQGHWEELIEVVKNMLHERWITTTVKISFKDKYGQSIGIVASNFGFWSLFRDYLKLRAGLPAISTVMVGVGLLGSTRRLSEDIVFAVLPVLLTAFLTLLEVIVRSLLFGELGIHYHVEK